MSHQSSAISADPNKYRLNASLLSSSVRAKIIKIFATVECDISLR